MRDQRHARPVFTLGKDPVPIVQKAGWAPERVWTGAENLDPAGIRFPDRPACSHRYTDYATRPTYKRGRNEFPGKMPETGTS